MFKFSLCYPLDGWDKFSHPYTRKEFGKWELVLPPKPDNSPAVDHYTKLKVENTTSSYLFSHPQQESSCHTGAKTCHRNAPGRFLVMCGVLWTKWKAGVSPSTTCHTHSAQMEITVCTQSAQWKVDTPEEPDKGLLFRLVPAAGFP